MTSAWKDAFVCSRIRKKKKVITLLPDCVSINEHQYEIRERKNDKATQAIWAARGGTSFERIFHLTNLRPKVIHQQDNF